MPSPLPSMRRRWAAFIAVLRKRPLVNGRLQSELINALGVGVAMMALLPGYEACAVTCRTEAACGPYYIGLMIANFAMFAVFLFILIGLAGHALSNESNAEASRKIGWNALVVGIETLFFFGAFVAVIVIMKKPWVIGTEIILVGIATTAQAGFHWFQRDPEANRAVAWATLVQGGGLFFIAVGVWISLASFGFGPGWWALVGAVVGALGWVLADLCAVIAQSCDREREGFNGAPCAEISAFEMGGAWVRWVGIVIAMVLALVATFTSTDGSGWVSFGSGWGSFGVAIAALLLGSALAIVNYRKKASNSPEIAPWAATEVWLRRCVPARFRNDGQAGQVAMPAVGGVDEADPAGGNDRGGSAVGGLGSPSGGSVGDARSGRRGRSAHGHRLSRSAGGSASSRDGAGQDSDDDSDDPDNDAPRGRRQALRATAHKERRSNTGTSDTSKIRGKRRSNSLSRAASRRRRKPSRGT